MNETSSIRIRNPEETNLCSGLYIVPTPIGNLRDITLRALDVLTACDVLVCEDSRVTGKLLKAYSIPAKKKIVYNDHANDDVKTHILSLIEGGKIVALVSDAGTPMISDPGYKLVRDCIKMGLYITALPGANAVLPAIQLSGMPSDKFTFAGFLPSKEKGVMDIVEFYKSRPETLLFYESPKRLLKTLSLIAQIMPDREVAVVREISKLYEESIVMKIDELAEHIDTNPVKGEIAIVIHGYEAGEADEIDIDTAILESLESGFHVKKIAAELSLKTGKKKKDIYDRAVTIKKDNAL